MIQTNIDSVVNSALMSLGLPIHWYADALKFGLDCLQELQWHTLPNIKSVRLTVNSDGEVDMPSDYVEHIRIGWQYGAYVIPMVEQGRFNRMQPEDGGLYSQGSDSMIPASYTSYLYGAHFNIYGESLGRYFGYSKDSVFQFIEIREREVFRFDPGIPVGTTIVLDYVYFDSATATALIHPLMAPVIEAYITWKIREQSRGVVQYNRFEKQDSRSEYYRKLRFCRAQLRGVTVEGVLKAVRSTQTRAAKL